MGTTSNYSWPYPEATGLVKDGWEDIKDLATAIDTTAASTFGGGFVKLNTTTFTGVSSQNITGLFSSTYDHYFLLLKAYAAADDVKVVLRFGTGGTYTAGTAYSYGFNTCTRSGAASTVSLNAGSSYRLTVCNNTSTQPAVSQTYIFNPNLATETALTTQSWNRRDNLSYNGGGFIENTTQYTDLQVLAESSNITGTITIFGVKK